MYGSLLGSLHMTQQQPGSAAHMASQLQLTASQLAAPPDPAAQNHLACRQLMLQVSLPCMLAVISSLFSTAKLSVVAVVKCYLLGSAVAVSECYMLGTAVLLEVRAVLLAFLATASAGCSEPISSAYQPCIIWAFNTPIYQSWYQ